MDTYYLLDRRHDIDNIGDFSSVKSQITALSQKADTRIGWFQAAIGDEWRSLLKPIFYDDYHNEGIEIILNENSNPLFEINGTAAVDIKIPLGTCVLFHQRQYSFRGMDYQENCYLTFEAPAITNLAVDAEVIVFTEKDTKLFSPAYSPLIDSREYTCYLNIKAATTVDGGGCLYLIEGEDAFPLFDSDLEPYKASLSEQILALTDKANILEQTLPKYHNLGLAEITIDSGSLDDYKTPGTYRSLSDNSYLNITNCPVAAGFKLVVEYSSTASRYLQTLTSSERDVFTRLWLPSGSTWTAWSKQLGSASTNLNNIIFTSSSEKIKVPAMINGGIFQATMSASFIGEDELTYTATGSAMGFLPKTSVPDGEEVALMKIIIPEVIIKSGGTTAESYIECAEYQFGYTGVFAEKSHSMQFITRTSLHNRDLTLDNLQITLTPIILF